jgi:hypothetical protein
MSSGNFLFISSNTTQCHTHLRVGDIFIALEVALPHLLTHTTQHDCPLDAKETTKDSQKAIVVL